MRDEAVYMQAETPGFFPVMEAGGRWGVVRAADRKIIRSGIATEQEARELAGTDSIRAEIAELCENAVRSVAERSVLMFRNRPHTEDYEMGCLIASIRSRIGHSLEMDLSKWASEISERIEMARIRTRARGNQEVIDRVNESLNKLSEVAEDKAREKEQADGID